MEKTTVYKMGKYTSIVVMLLTAIATIIVGMEGYLSDKDYGQLLIAFGVFIVALRNYLKDKQGLG